MVVHDLRNPSESIKYGLQIAKKILNQNIIKQIDEFKVFVTDLLDKQQYLNPASPLLRPKL